LLQILKIIMKKELTITVEIDKFKIKTSPELEDWNSSSDVDRIEYIKNEVQEYLILNMNEIIYNLIKNNKIHI